MIAVDTNLLVYAHREDASFPWQPENPLIHCGSGLRRGPFRGRVSTNFIGTAAHPGIYKPASTLAEALGFVDALLASPQLHLLSESPGYFEKMRDIATNARLSGPRIHDARIAALCLHHGVSELWSAERDFSAFQQLNVRNPLVKR